MKYYSEIQEYLAEYKLDPPALDAMAWALLIGGLGSFSDDKYYLKHFSGNDEEVVYDFFINRISHNTSLLEEDELNLLLPDDEEEISTRLKAISIWCDTFVSCLGCSEHLKEQSFATKITPILNDLAQISQVDSLSSNEYSNLEEAELDYMELYEFIKVNIISLNMEFRGFEET